MNPIKIFLAFALLAAATTPGRASDPKHTVKPGDNLWDLSIHYYGDPWIWERIYSANRPSIRNPHWIFPGQILDIPELSTAPAPAPPPAPPREGLSEGTPKDQPGYAPSEIRMRVESDWKADGVISPPPNEEAPMLLEPGQSFVASLRPGLDPAAGTRFWLLRMDSVKTGDSPGSRHVVRFGTAAVLKRTGPGRYEMTVVKAVDAAEEGNLLQEEPSR